MIFITAKFLVRAEDADRWPAISAAFTQATRNEPGCMWYDWSRSLDNPQEYVLVEAFRDDDAAVATIAKAVPTRQPRLAPARIVAPLRRSLRIYPS